MTIQEHIYRIAMELNDAIRNDFMIRKILYPFFNGQLKQSESAHVKPGRKFTKIDIGSSGAFMVRNTTGEIYNIKSYGVPDYNKKKKADIGNIATVDAQYLFSKRYNYLR